MELLKKVKRDFSSDDIAEMFDLEILEWDYGYDPDDIENEWSCRYDFYIEYGGGEAENAVCDQILSNYGTNRNKLFDENLLYKFEEELSIYSSIDFEV